MPFSAPSRASGGRTLGLWPRAAASAPRAATDPLVIAHPVPALPCLAPCRIYGPSVCDQGIPRHCAQLYAATLSNPAGQPLAVHISLPDTIVRRELQDRLRWMGARCTADDEPADMYLANVHNVITKVRGGVRGEGSEAREERRGEIRKRIHWALAWIRELMRRTSPWPLSQAAREAGKPVVRPLWVNMCWQQFLDSKGVLVEVRQAKGVVAAQPAVRLWPAQRRLPPLPPLPQGDREYRLPPLAGCKIAFAMVGVTQRTREIMHDCAKQCGATILDDVDER